MDATTLTAVKQALLAELSRARQESMAIVEEMIGESEGEIIAATKSITGINKEARRHVKDLESLATRFGSQIETITSLMARQESFSGELARKLREQHGIVNGSLGLTNKIVQLADSINTISHAMSMLTINGHIEAARLGSAGRAFSVIVEQLQLLGVEVQSANETITDLAGSLASQIPSIAETSEELLRITDQHSAAQAAAFHQTMKETERWVQGALTETQESAKKILDRSGRLLTHLQFQDRMAQELREIEHISIHSEGVLGHMLERLEAQQQDGGTSTAADVERALAEGREETSRATTRIGQIEGDPGADAPQEGAVILF